MHRGIQLKGPAGVVFLGGVLLLLGVQWFFPEILPRWLRDAEMSYSLFRSGHVTMRAASAEKAIPGFGNSGHYETGWILTFGGEELVLKREIVTSQGHVTLRVSANEWGTIPTVVWREEVRASVADTVRVPLPEAGTYELDVEHWQMNGRLAIDWSVQSPAAD
jgi:hypothetical protein